MNFVLLHHGACANVERAPALLHYVINADGAVVTRLSESEQGLHRAAIGICVDGDFDVDVPTAQQISAIHGVLLDIKLRYPGMQLGAHRQVHGERCTCPGKRFPMRRLREWTEQGLLDARDAALEALIERQYRP